MIVSVPSEHKSSKYIQKYCQQSLNFQRKPYGEKGKQTPAFNITATEKGFARKVSLGSGYNEAGGISALSLPAPGGCKQMVLLHSRGLKVPNRGYGKRCIQQTGEEFPSQRI